VALAGEYGYPFWGSWAAVLLGAGLCRRGLNDEGIAQIDEGLAAFRATGAELWCSHFLALLAEALGMAGQPDGGLQRLAEARDSMAATGERMYQCELQRLEGDLMLMRGAAVGSSSSDDELVAQACFERAIETAHRQGARSLELRAALSRSRLWRQQGRAREARTALIGICETIGEGSDGDLGAARSFLAQAEA
jgi:predicted ATPase